MSNMNSMAPSQWSALLDAISQSGGGSTTDIVAALGDIATNILELRNNIQASSILTDREVTGIPADNVEDALTELNSTLGEYRMRSKLGILSGGSDTHTFALPDNARYAMIVLFRNSNGIYVVDNLDTLNTVVAGSNITNITFDSDTRTVTVKRNTTNTAYYMMLYAYAN